MHEYLFIYLLSWIAIYVSEVKYCFILFAPSENQFFITKQNQRKRRAQIIQKPPLDQNLQRPQQHKAIITILAFKKRYAIHFLQCTPKTHPKCAAHQRPHPGLMVIQAVPLIHLCK